ncbi:MAG: TlpA disulfide reductase family protein, partial [Cyclobacteriaceae bacterium]
ALKNVTDEYYESVASSQTSLKNYFKDIAPSLAVFYGIGSLDPEQNFDFYSEIATIYQAEVPNHPFTKDLVYQVATMRKLAIGQEAPEIALPSPDGDLLKLSSLKGNYVLVDFWAAWCRPCRAENPNVVRMYNEYSDKNFEILGVSLDRNREAWLKAIDDDGLKWKHVSDLKYFNSEAAADYKINAIPATYLIGPDGKIIAKNLRGPSLEAKLKEIFG